MQKRGRTLISFKREFEQENSIFSKNTRLAYFQKNSVEVADHLNNDLRPLVTFKMYCVIFSWFTGKDDEMSVSPKREILSAGTDRGHRALRLLVGKPECLSTDDGDHRRKLMKLVRSTPLYIIAGVVYENSEHK